MLVPANRSLRLPSQTSVQIQGGYRVIQTNGIPGHRVGAFPNSGIPHSIAQQRSTYRVTLTPQQNRQPRPVGMDNFGIGLNGILFDAGAAEFWIGNPSSGWQYEALGGAVPLGLDANYAHVQPDGKYHYHGIPTGLVQQLQNKNRSEHSPLVGWAADGFPIYAVTGYADPMDAQSDVVALQPGYGLKSGTRPGGRRGTQIAPGGTYDGAFVNDYEFEEGSGDLDRCNGRFCVTPEFPNGTYAYFLTTSWPVVPRHFAGTPNSSFEKRMGPPGGWGPGSGNPPHPPRRR